MDDKQILSVGARFTSSVATILGANVLRNDNGAPRSFTLDMGSGPCPCCAPLEAALKGIPGVTVRCLGYGSKVPAAFGESTTKSSPEARTSGEFKSAHGGVVGGATAAKPIGWGFRVIPRSVPSQWSTDGGKGSRGWAVALAEALLTAEASEPGEMSAVLLRGIGAAVEIHAPYKGDKSPKGDDPAKAEGAKADDTEERLHPATGVNRAAKRMEKTLETLAEASTWYGLRSLEMESFKASDFVANVVGARAALRSALAMMVALPSDFATEAPAHDPAVGDVYDVPKSAVDALDVEGIDFPIGLARVVALAGGDVTLRQCGPGGSPFSGALSTVVRVSFIRREMTFIGASDAAAETEKVRGPQGWYDTGVSGVVLVLPTAAGVRWYSPAGLRGDEPKVPTSWERCDAPTDTGRIIGAALDKLRALDKGK